MKELVLFYSYSGNTKKAAQKFGEENSCDICEVLDEKKPGKLAAFIPGIVKALKGGGRKIKPLIIINEQSSFQNGVKFEDYGAVNVFAPIWAGHPAPSMNTALKMLPGGTKIKLFMVSQSGESAKDNISKRVQAMGLEIVGYEDIKM